MEFANIEIYQGVTTRLLFLPKSSIYKIALETEVVKSLPWSGRSLHMVPSQAAELSLLLPGSQASFSYFPSSPLTTQVYVTLQGEIPIRKANSLNSKSWLQASLLGKSFPADLQAVHTQSQTSCLSSSEWAEKPPRISAVSDGINVIR